jgi:hypothetical protein
MRQIYQTLLSEKELYQAIMDYLHTHGIPDANIDDITILYDGGNHEERVTSVACSDMVRISYSNR